MKYNFKFCLLCFFFCYLSCEPWVMDRRYSIRTFNQSESPVVVVDGLKMGNKYPDTSIVASKISSYITVEKNMYGYLLDSSIDFVSFYKQNGIDTLSFFIFDAEVLKNDSWVDIQQNYRILGRYDLSAYDLNELPKGRLYYPPTEQMKGMKIYLKK